MLIGTFLIFKKLIYERKFMKKIVQLCLVISLCGQLYGAHDGVKKEVTTPPAPKTEMSASTKSSPAETPAAPKQEQPVTVPTPDLNSYSTEQLLVFLQKLPSEVRPEIIQILKPRIQNLSNTQLLKLKGFLQTAEARELLSPQQSQRLMCNYCGEMYAHLAYSKLANTMTEAQIKAFERGDPECKQDDRQALEDALLYTRTRRGTVRTAGVTFDATTGGMQWKDKDLEDAYKHWIEVEKKFTEALDKIKLAQQKEKEKRKLEAAAPVKPTLASPENLEAPIKPEEDQTPADNSGAPKNT